MSSQVYERPGVYSEYDASSVVSAGQGGKVVGVAAKATVGPVGECVTVTSWSAGFQVFGQDNTPGMCTLLQLLFANGASVVQAVRVDNKAGATDYEAAFEVLSRQDVQIIVCDSADLEVHMLLRSIVKEVSAARRERIAIVGGSGENLTAMLEHAALLNCERMALVGPDALDQSGNELPAPFAAAAVAGVIAAGRDPAVPINGVELNGLGGVSQDFSDQEINLLVRGGVLPLESVGGIVSPVRGITTRTKTGSAEDATWRELTTILIVDDIIPAVRNALRSKFVRAKNTARSRGAIRSQVIVELEKKLAAEIIDSYGDVTVTASPEDPTVCLVEFGFAVAHGLNQIYLTVHITV